MGIPIYAHAFLKPLYVHKQLMHDPYQLNCSGIKLHSRQAFMASSFFVFELLNYSTDLIILN